jgi:hypothetical protein
MEISEAVVVYDGHGVTTKIRRLTTTAMTVHANVTPAAGDTVTVFIAGVGKMVSRVTYVSPPRIDLSFLTDTQERWRQLHLLRQELA